MVCLDDGIICVPIYSKSGAALCLSGSLKCNGENDCQYGSDEQDCPISLDGSHTALIVLAVIVLIILIPVIYIVVRRKQGRAVLPNRLQLMFNRISTCCKFRDGNRSAQHLTGVSHGNVSTGSDSKDGFTNVGFEPGSASVNAVVSAAAQQYSITGRPLNKFKQAVEGSEPERLSSYRDWQVNRLQKTPPSSNSPKLGNGRQPGKHEDVGSNTQSVELNNIADHSLGSRVQPQAVLHQGPITYAPSTNRQAAAHGGSAQRTPYAIASQDGKSSYEAKSHLRRDEELSSSSSSRRTAPSSRYQPSWQQHVAPKQHHTGTGATQLSNPNYESYEQISTAVPPHQLRQALEKVAQSTPSKTSYQQETGYNASADTVV